MSYEVLIQEKTNEPGIGTLGFQIQQYFLGELSAETIFENIRENICVVQEDAEADIITVLNEYAVKWYSSPRTEAEVIAEAVRAIISLL